MFLKICFLVLKKVLFSTYWLFNKLGQNQLSEENPRSNYFFFLLAVTKTSGP